MSEVSRLCPSPRNLCSGNMCPASHVHTLTANLLPDCVCMNACGAQRCLPQLLSILYPPFPWCGGHAHECEVVCIMREPEDDVGCFLSLSASSPRNRVSPQWKTQFSARQIGQQPPGICLCLPAHPPLGSDACIDFAGGCCAFKSRSPCTRGECFPP